MDPDSGIGERKGNPTIECKVTHATWDRRSFHKNQCLDSNSGMVVVINLWQHSLSEYIHHRVQYAEYTCGLSIPDLWLNGNNMDGTFEDSIRRFIFICQRFNVTYS